MKQLTEARKGRENSSAKHDKYGEQRPAGQQGQNIYIYIYRSSAKRDIQLVTTLKIHETETAMKHTSTSYVTKTRLSETWKRITLTVN